MRLTSKFLSDFEIRDVLPDNDASEYAVLFDDHSFKGRDIFCKTEQCPYVIHLSDCTLYPNRLINNSPETLASSAPPPFDTRGGNLLVTRDGQVTCGSLTRDFSLPRNVNLSEDGVWDLALPQAADEIDEPVVFAELICAHFGHALIDTPARLWYRLEPSLERIKKLKLVAFGTHGLGKTPGLQRSSEWPSYLKLILGAIGVDLQDIKIIRRPTKIRSLFVPKRLSPYGSNYGYSKRYLDLMIAAGDSIISAEASSPQTSSVFGKISSFPWNWSFLGHRTSATSATERDLSDTSNPRDARRLVYLSRSKLDQSLRGLVANQELIVEDIFRQHGFHIVHPQLLPLSDQILTVRGASHIAGCVGSHMHLTAFSRNAGKHVMRIAPSYFNTEIDKEILEMGGGKYQSFVVERIVPENFKVGKLPWQLMPEEISDLQQKLKKWLITTST